MEEDVNWPLLFLLAIVFDFSDFLGGAVPIVGDFFDLVETGIFFFLAKDPIALAPMVELIPLADALPSFTLSTAYLYFRRERS